MLHSIQGKWVNDISDVYVIKILPSLCSAIYTLIIIIKPNFIFPFFFFFFWIIGVKQLFPTLKKKKKNWKTGVPARAQWGKNPTAAAQVAAEA